MRNLTRMMSWALLVTLCALARPVAGQQSGAARSAGTSGVQIDKNSMGGVVLNSDGAKPEAGVWVIAETKSLPVPFRKIVVTDDQGRFLVPDLPEGEYELWVRGYGLKDSERLSGVRGGQVKLRVASADTPQQAAKISTVSDGVIVGSALVKIILEGASAPEVETFVRSFRDALDATSKI